MEVDALQFHNWITSEFIRGVELERIYRLPRSRLPALLWEGLNVDWEKNIVHIGYLEDGEGWKAFFEVANEVTGSFLVGADVA